jgi:orotidine-5'-phosphate decarboxylase
MRARDRLIVALDVPGADEARALVGRLAGHVGLFKVGSQAFTAAGPDLVREIVARGERVFLDLKFHDIPNTVAGAVASASRLGVSLVDVHGLGGRAMIEAAAGALPAMGTRLLAITILTSHDEGTLGEIGVKARCSTPSSGSPGSRRTRARTASWRPRTRWPRSARPAGATS